MAVSVEGLASAVKGRVVEAGAPDRLVMELVMTKKAK